MDIKHEPEGVTDHNMQYNTQWRNYKDEFVKIEYTPPIKSEMCFSPADVDIERQSVFQDVAMGLGNIKNETNSMSAETTVENVLRIKVEELDGERSTSPSNTATSSMHTHDASSDPVPFMELHVDKENIIKEHANEVTRDFSLNNPTLEQVAVIRLKQILLYEKYFVCSVCYGIFSNIIEQKHHKEIHNQPTGLNVKRQNKMPDSEADKLVLGMHSCTKCVFKCTTLSDMKAHEKIHCGEKTNANNSQQETFFKCEQCNYISMHSWHMKTHKMIHSGEKPFKCKECDYSCINLTDMKRHTMIHSGERPFKCDKCDYSCIRPRYLRVHKMKHSTEKAAHDTNVPISI